MTYNGWTNYETWVVKLWMDNDQGSCEYFRDMMEDVKSNPPENKVWTSKQRIKFALADRVKDYHENCKEDLEGIQGTVLSDLLDAALSEVNWTEIAANMLEDE